MGVDEFFNEMVRLNLWDGRLIGIPFLFAVVRQTKNGLRSQELAEIVDEKPIFILN